MLRASHNYIPQLTRRADLNGFRLMWFTMLPIRYLISELDWVNATEWSVEINQVQFTLHSLHHVRTISTTTLNRARSPARDEFKSNRVFGIHLSPRVYILLDYLQLNESLCWPSACSVISSRLEFNLTRKFIALEKPTWPRSRINSLS